jgi:hypothetical protein
MQLDAGRPLHIERFLVVISIRSEVEPRAIARLEGLCHWKNEMTNSGIESATFSVLIFVFVMFGYVSEP